MTAMDELVCRELVEMITDYLDGALTAQQARRFEEHLAGCVGCETYLEQMRHTLRDLSRLPGATLPDSARDALVAALRNRPQPG